MDPLPPLSPAQAKQRYLESKLRTDAFLRDPHAKIQQLQTEMNDVKARATERLEKEVYNKPYWRRLIDPLKRKQHSVINLLAGTMAYILAHQLHLKRKAYQEAVSELEEEREKTQKLRALLQSLLDENCIHELEQAAEVAAADGKDVSNSTATTNGIFGWWSTSSPSSSSPRQNTTSDTGYGDDGRPSVRAALLSVLESRIGDEGLDDETRKQKALNKIWEENKEQLKKKPTASEELDDELALVLSPLILGDNEMTDKVQGDLGADVATPEVYVPPSKGKPRRVFDM